MSEKKPYHIPDFIVQDLNNGQEFPASDALEIENILLTSEHFPYPGTEIESNWQSLSNKIGSPLTVSKKPVINRQFGMFKWVAAAIVVLSIGIGVWQVQKKQSDNFTSIYKTQGNRESISLPDGSSINLNTFTELEVKTMNSVERILSLKSGEAYFKVKHNQLPFKVTTNKGDVMVTGTEFNIKSRREIPFAVYLKTGKVRFRSAEGILNMNPGECLKEAGLGHWMVSKINDGSQCAWINDKLVFNSQALSEIIKELEATYNVKFVFDDNLKSEKFNFVCDNKLNAAQVADLLTKVVSSKVTIE